MPDPISPVTPVPTLLPPSGTPESIKSLREYVKQLASQKYQPPNSKYPFYTAWNGLADASGKIMAGMASREADERERNLYGGLAKSATTGLDPTSAVTPPSGGPAASGAPGPRADISGDFNPAYSRTVAEIESSGNPNAPPNSGGNRGLYQFGPAEERKYGLNAKNWNDPASQHAALEREYKEHSKLLEDKGLPVNEHNLYFTHQQGVGGGPALLNAPAEMSAWRVLRPMYKSDAAAKSAITGNIYPGFPKYGQPVDEITAGDFRNGWRDKFYNVRGRFGDKAPAEGATLTPPAVEAPRGPVSSSGSRELPAGALKFASAEIPGAGAGGIDHDFAQKMIAAQIAKNGGLPPMQMAQAAPLPPGPGPVPPTNQVTGVPSAASTFTGAPGRPSPSLQPEVPPPGTTEGTVGGLGAAAGRLVPPGPAMARPAPTATPTAPPASAAPAGPPDHIPGTASIPQGLNEQIQGYVRSGIPAMVAEGTKLANEWRDRINVVTPYTTPDGRVYVGNEYKGWTLSKLPSKPTIEKFQYDVGGVKGEEPKQLIYDAQGRPVYRTIPTESGGPATGGAIDDPFPVNGSVPEKAAWADRHNIRQAGEKKAAEEREGAIGKTVGDNQSDYIKGFKPSREAIANIDSMQEALKSLPNPAAGPLSHYYSGIARTIKELTGVEVPGTTEGQIIEKGGTMLAIHTAKELTSRPTQFDFKATMEKANPNLFQTKEGIGYLLNIQRQQHFQNVELSRLAESTPSKDWPKARDQYYKEHPLVSPLTGKEWTRDVASEDAAGITKGGTTSAYQIGQQAKNPKTGQTMIYTKDGWIAK